MLDQFTQQAAGVGAECRLAGDRSQAIDWIVSVLQREGVEDVTGCWAVWANDALMGEEERREILRRAPGVRFEVSRETAAQSLVGISQMDWGVAQTGTLLSNASAVDSRLVSTLPPIHVALLSVSRIVFDMATALARVDVRRCAYVAAITGPSRTADIERVLTIGVHGPRRLLIVLIQDSEHGGAKE